MTKDDLPLSLTADGKPPFRKHHTEEDRKRWHAQYLALLEESVPQEQADIVAADLHARGGKQTSRRYRSVSALPFTPTEGQKDFADVSLMVAHVKRLDPQAARVLWDRFFEMAADHYRTHLASRDGNAVTLDLRTFEAFKTIERERDAARYAALTAKDKP